MQHVNVHKIGIRESWRRRGWGEKEVIQLLFCFATELNPCTVIVSLRYGLSQYKWRGKCIQDICMYDIYYTVGYSTCLACCTEYTCKVRTLWTEKELSVQKTSGDGLTGKVSIIINKSVVEQQTLCKGK